MSFDDGSEPGMGFGLGDLLSQVQQMQEMIASAQAEASDQVVVGEAGDGAVQVSVTGGLEFQSVKIDQTVVDQGDSDLLEDLVLVALRDAMAKVGELNLSAMAHSGLDDLAGMDLGLGEFGLHGLAGGADDDEEDEDEGQTATIRPIEMGSSASGGAAEHTDSGAEGDAAKPAD